MLEIIIVRLPDESDGFIGVKAARYQDCLLIEYTGTLAGASELSGMIGAALNKMVEHLGPGVEPPVTGSGAPQLTPNNAYPT